MIFTHPLPSSRIASHTAGLQWAAHARAKFKNTKWPPRKFHVLDPSSGDLTDLDHAYNDLPPTAAILLHAGARSSFTKNVAA